VGRGKKKRGIRKKQWRESKERGRLFRFRDLWLIGCSSGLGFSPVPFLEAKRKEPMPERACAASDSTVVGMLEDENLDCPRCVLALGLRKRLWNRAGGKK